MRALKARTGIYHTGKAMDSVEDAMEKKMAMSGDEAIRLRWTTNGIDEQVDQKPLKSSSEWPTARRTNVSLRRQVARVAGSEAGATIDSDTIRFASVGWEADSNVFWLFER